MNDDQSYINMIIELYITFLRRTVFQEKQELSYINRYVTITSLRIVIGSSAFMTLSRIF